MFEYDRIHFIELDLDHTGYHSMIYEYDRTGDINDFELVIMDDYEDELYKVIKLSDTEMMFLIKGNIRLYAWATHMNLYEQKFFEHLKRYDEPMTICEYRDFKRKEREDKENLIIAPSPRKNREII